MRKLFNNKLWVIFPAVAMALVLSSHTLCGQPQAGEVANVAAGTVPVSQSGLVCTYALDPTNRTHTYLSEAAIVNVLAPSGCDWTVVNTNDWMIIKLYTNGTGTGIVRYTVFPNPNLSDRTGVLTIGGEPFTVSQLGAPCAYFLLPTNHLFGSGSAAGTVTVFTMDGCGWTVDNTNRWITITSAPNGTGNGTVSYAVAPTYSPTDRTGIISVAGQPFTVNQLATPCRYSISPTSRAYAFGVATGTVSVTTTAVCTWNVVNPNDWITLTSGPNGAGSGIVSYTVAANPSSLARTGVVSIADQPVTLSQTGVPCTYALAPTNQAHGFGVELGVLSVTAPLGCAWTVRNTNSWITLISSTKGSGSGTVGYQVTTNPGLARSGILLIAGVPVTVNQAQATAPLIVSPPARQSVLAGATAVFNVGASGSAPLSYQWQFNGLNLADSPTVSGATRPSLTLSNVQWWQAGNYAVVVSNIRGPVTSAPPVVLTVNTAPVLAAIGNKTVSQGAPLAFRALGSDVDIPAQTLTYGLGAGAPMGANLDPVTGLFTWTATQAPGTTRVSLRVTDSGSPPLSASQSLDISVVTAFMTNLTLVTTGSVWKYRDSGQDLGTAWTAPAFNDSVWKSGPAKLGYGNGNEATIVSYGSSSSAKYITAYFRRAFTVADPSLFSALNLRVLRDDGAVVYLNGSEVYRGNMPSGPLNYLTLAAATVSASDKTNYFASPPLDPGYLVPGVNMVAVELHQRSASTSAAAFDLEMGGTQSFLAPAIFAQPQSQSLLEGAMATLSVTAVGALPLYHQWYFNGVFLPKATNATLSLPNILSSQSGGYFDVVTNPMGSVTSAVATLTVTPVVNTAPVLAPIENKTVSAGSLLTFTAAASDADVPAQTLSYSLDAGTPTGASINPTSGVFTWTAAAAQTPSTISLTVRVTDNGSPPLSAAQTVSITIVTGVMTNLTLIPTNSVWKYRDTGEDLGAAWTALAYNDSLWKSGPALLGYAGGGEATVVGYGPNSSAKYITTYFRRVFTLGDPSALSALNLRVRRDDGVVGYLNGSEVYRDNMPAGPINYLTPAPLSVSGTDKTSYHVSPTVAAAYLVAGDNLVAVEVHQHSGNSTSMDFDLELAGTAMTANNTAPVLAGLGNKTVGAGNLLTFTAAATDGDVPAQTLTYSLDAGAPAGASINAATGVFTWVPSASQGPSTNAVTIRVRDSGSPALSDVETITVTVTVTATNTAPVLAAIGNKTVIRGSPLAFTASANDPDIPAQTLIYSLDAGAPSGASINPTNGLFTWTAAAAQTPSAISVTIRVTDNGSPSRSAAQTFSIAVIAGVTGVTTNLTLIPTNSVWKYRDTGENLGTAWTALAYNDGLWKSGPALLGYAGGGEATVVGHGPNSSAKYITTYFRRVFTLGDPATFSPLNLRVRRDDGVVVYLNGSEIYRDNMPAGPINYLTPAPLSVSGTDKTSYHVSPPVAAAYLVAGDNLVAVEVHQHSGSSSSMDFDLQLTGTAMTANNTAPVLGGLGNKTVSAGSLLTFTAATTDADVPGQSLTYSLDAGAPAGANIDPRTGVFAWAPTVTQAPSTNAVTIRVTDSGSPVLSDFETITIVVNELNAVRLVVGATNGPPGAQVFAPVLVNGFTNISSVQFSLHWDMTVAAYVDVEQFGLSGINTATDQTNGTLTVSWDDLGGLSESLADGTTLFAVQLRLIGVPGTASSVWIDGTPTQMEAANGDLQMVPIVAIPGQSAGPVNLQISDGNLPVVSEPPITNTVLEPPLITIAVDSGGEVAVWWTSSLGKTYRVQYTAALPANVWADLGDKVIATGSTASATDVPGANRQRFYRVLRLD